MMSDFSRTSQAIPVAALGGPLHDALVERVALDGHPGLIAEAIAACQTESRPLRRRLLGPKVGEHHHLIVLTPSWLLWATDASGEPHAAGCRLAEAHVRRFESTLVEDVGLDVTAFLLSASAGRSSAFLPVDDGVDGRRFVELVIHTVAVSSTSNDR